MLRDHRSVLKAIIDEASKQYLYDPRPYLTPPQVRKLRQALPPLISKHPGLCKLGPAAAHLFSLVVWGKGSARYLFKGKQTKSDSWNGHLKKPEGGGWDPLANTRVAADAVLIFNQKRHHSGKSRGDAKLNEPIPDAPVYKFLHGLLEDLIERSSNIDQHEVLKKLVNTLLGDSRGRSDDEALREFTDLIWRCWRFEEALRNDLMGLGSHLLKEKNNHRAREQWERYLPMLLAGITLWWTPGKDGGKRDVEGIYYGWAINKKEILTSFPFHRKCWGLEGEKLTPTIDLLIRHRVKLADGTMTAASEEMQRLISEDVLPNSLLLRFIAGGVIVSPNTFKPKSPPKLSIDYSKELNNERRSGLNQITKAAALCSCKPWQFDMAQVTANFWWCKNKRNGNQSARIERNADKRDLKVIPAPGWHAVGDFLHDLTTLLTNEDPDLSKKHAVIIRAIESGRFKDMKGRLLIDTLAREQSLEHLRQYHDECRPSSKQFKDDCKAVGLKLLDR